MASFESSVTLNPESTPEDIVKPVTKRKRKSVMAVEEIASTEPQVKKTKKMLLSEKYSMYVKNNAKNLVVDRMLLTQQNIFEDYKEYFEDPVVIKAYCLPLFHFLDAYAITISKVSSFETVTVQTSAGIDKLEELKKLSKDLALSPEDMDLLVKKFSKKNWKVPTKDYKRIQDLFNQKKEVTMQLVGVDISEFQGKDGELCVSLNPRLRYF